MTFLHIAFSLTIALLTELFNFHWLAACLGFSALGGSISVFIKPSPTERKKGKRNNRRERERQ